MCENNFQDILLELDQNGLIAVLKSDPRFSEQDFSKYTIEELGDRFLPETIDGAFFHYAVRPRYWDQLKQEFKKLLCTSDKKYASLRKEVSTASNKAYTTIVSSIAAVMASQFGVVPGVLMPFCALILIAILKLGKEAFCACAQLDISVE
jgi:hypothetical protein